MTEITRVPLQPIAKGSLTKLWVAIVVAILAAAAIAWLTVPAGVSVKVLKAGEGAHPGPSDVVFVEYTGKLDDGTVFDQSQPLPLPPAARGLLPQGTPLPLDNMLPGFREAMVKMQRGGSYVAHVPSSKAYGATPPPGAPIPPNADLTFDIQLIDFMPRDEFEGRVQVIQQMLGQAQGGPGGPGGPAGAPGESGAGAPPPIQ